MSARTKMLAWAGGSAGTLTAVAGLLYACGVTTPAATDHKTPLLVHAGKTDDGCDSCHQVDRPAATHGGGHDCVGCHSPVDDANGSWLPAHPFTHDPAPSTCLPCHTAERPAPPHAASGDCAGCHKFPAWKK